MLKLAVMTEAEIATLLAHDERHPFGAVVPLIAQTSLFTFESFEAMAAAGTPPGGSAIYSRGNNPTVRLFEEKMARLEGGGAARAFSSGMAAISTAVMSRLRAGDRVVCVCYVYPDAFKLFTRLLARFGVETQFVDGSDMSAVAAALPGSALLYLESPTSHLFELQDLSALTALAREHGVFTIMDNSWATPLFQQPLAHGVDMVVHSASKFLGGHSDVVAGVVVGREDDVRSLDGLEYLVLGGKLSPIEAWLLLRGLRTLVPRMRQHHVSALAIAKRLVSHPLVTRVYYPFLDDHRQAALARKYLSGAPGPLSFELSGDVAAVRYFVNSLKVFRIGVSWGGHESLVYPAALAHLQPGDTPVRRFAIPEMLVRLHVGLEDVEALWRDLDQALAVAGDAAH
jgi:cystathionine beta-lyase/cystathionine gamma-synthase